MILSIELTPEQMDSLAAAVAAKLREMPRTEARPLNVEEFAAATGMSKPSVYRRVEAGEIRRVAGIARILIPASELERFQ